MKPDKVQHYEGWAVVAVCNYEYEAQMIKDTLIEGGIEAMVLSQKDHALPVPVGDMSEIKVLVNEESYEEARAVVADIQKGNVEIDNPDFSDDESDEEDDV